MPAAGGALDLPVEVSRGGRNARSPEIPGAEATAGMPGVLAV